MSEILLSICIPTYNRVDLLTKCIDSIVNQIGFEEFVEIVISDNHSTDNTRYVIEEFQEKNSNIKYLRNDTNIGMEKNILQSLSMGQGKYLKLINDYAIFYEGSLQKIIDAVNENVASHSVLFFLNKAIEFNEGITSCDTMDQFIQYVSFQSTWIMSFGI